MNKFFDYSEYQKTGNVAMDLIAACVGHYRKMAKPLKAIYLEPRYFGRFLLFIAKEQKKQGVEFDEHANFEFDGVNICRGSRIMSDSIMVEFYTPEKQAEA